ncbi:alpha/beta hydrolase [Tessaracoccus sp. G1721]
MRARLIAALGAGAAIAGAVALRRRVERRRPAVDAVAPDLRAPWLYLLPEEHSGRRPRRRPKVEEFANRAIVRGGAVPQRFDNSSAGFLYDPPGRARPSGAVLWIHGGGMITGMAAINHGVGMRVSRELGILVATVDYRLAPEHPFPAALDDCMAALRWLHDNAERLGIDPSRIAVGGESAGGGLAAMVTQRALDEGVPVAFQVLIYPMLDDRTVHRDPGHRGQILWTPSHNRHAWEWFLGHPVREEEDRPCASAARRRDLTGLPPAWIGVGDLDLFHDEDLEYARRLEEAGVAVQLEVVPGMPHGMDMVPAPSMKAFTASWVAALRRALADPDSTGQ